MKYLVFPLFFICSCFAVSAQKPSLPTLYVISMPHPETHCFHVSFSYTQALGDSIDFSMPAWTPGYYQIMDYAKDVVHFSVEGARHAAIPRKKISANTWRVYPGKEKMAHVTYDVMAGTRFVANSYLDSTHAYIVPGSVLVYPEGQIGQAIKVAIEPAPGWHSVATGLDSIAHLKGASKEVFVFRAHNFDELYDAPILVGNLEELPSFRVKGVVHRFIGIDLGTFDRAQFVKDLQSIVEAGAAMMENIPYRQYTFLAIGEGRGGIEHANSSSLSFEGAALTTPGGRRQMLSFIAHEYFHLYNVKRIRPIELGPFDYQHANRTHLLWVSEGFTVYYEYLLLRRAGLTTTDELLKGFESNIAAYENTTGRLHQSLIEASYDTWSDGPFGNSSGGLDKTISYYDKGPVVGLLLDFAIRHATAGRRSLDDVMRLLYARYYQQQDRGFTDQEFRQACEDIAGVSLEEVFEYATTVKDLDYAQYLGYAGLRLVKEEAKSGARFTIVPVDKPDALQLRIEQSWSRNTP